LGGKMEKDTPSGETDRVGRREGGRSGWKERRAQGEY